MQPAHEPESAAIRCQYYGRDAVVTVLPWKLQDALAHRQSAAKTNREMTCPEFEAWERGEAADGRRRDKVCLLFPPAFCILH